MSTFNLKSKIEAILKPFAKAVGTDIKAILASIQGVKTDLNNKQNKLNPGAGIHIGEDGTISAAIGDVDMQTFAKKAETQVKLVAPEDGSITVAEDGHIALAEGFVKEADLVLDGLDADLLAAYKEGKGETEGTAPAAATAGGENTASPAAGEPHASETGSPVSEG